MATSCSTSQLPCPKAALSGAPSFGGDFVQGTPARRFIYIDVGTYAGQKNTPWSRRMIVLLNGITLEQITRALKPGHRLSASIQGTGKDGGPELRDGETDRRLDSRERLTRGLSNRATEGTETQNKIITRGVKAAMSMSTRALAVTLVLEFRRLRSAATRQDVVLRHKQAGG